MTIELGHFYKTHTGEALRGNPERNPIGRGAVFSERHGILRRRRTVQVVVTSPDSLSVIKDGEIVSITGEEINTSKYRHVPNSYGGRSTFTWKA